MKVKFNFTKVREESLISPLGSANMVTKKKKKRKEKKTKERKKL